MIRSTLTDEYGSKWKVLNEQGDTLRAFSVDGSFLSEAQGNTIEKLISELEAIEEITINDIDNSEEKKGFVNVYSVTRHYGGPEEGGWWYNRLECIESFPCRYENRLEVMNYMDTEHANKRYGDIYSVLGGKEITMRWEESPSQSETKERPYYE